MTACADRQQEEDSWSVIVKKCEDLAMSKKAGDTFAPNAQAQAPGNNTGLGKTRESVSFLVFLKKRLNRNAGSRFHGQRGHNNTAMASGEHAALA